MRILLAFRVFFAVLFGWALPDELRALPEGEAPRPGPDAVADARAALAAAAEAPVADTVRPTPAADTVRPTPAADTARPAPVPAPTAPAPAPPAAAAPAPAEDPRRLDAAAVRVLSVLQSEGRLLDFLSEDIDGYADADVGAAVRDIHKGLKKALRDHFPVEPLRPEDEDAALTVPVGFDPGLIRLVGNVVGAPPFSGRLKHKGWKVTAVHLPRVPTGDAAFVVTPAEVEL